MKSTFQLKTAIPPLLITLALPCFWPLPRAQAVSPAPDGGYPGFNTAQGQNALFSLDTSTGFANTAVGSFSLKSIVGNSFNTAVGVGALLLNIAGNNTAVGGAALLLNAGGTNNTAVGAAALLNNTEGDRNTAIGFDALSGNTTINGNSGVDNTAVGSQALTTNTTGDNNTAIGSQALSSNTVGRENTAIGAFALFNNTNQFNTAIGANALVDNTTGFNNTGVGDSALDSSTGDGNTALGAFAGVQVTTANNVICIGHPGQDVSNSCFIGNIRDVQTQNADAIAVVIDSAGQLGTASSSRRFKKEIKPMEKASEAILALKPVTFHYKNAKKGSPQFGLIAEEVAEVNPDLVVRDKNGQVYTVRYDAVNAMLLNEFLKEHATVQQLKKEIAVLKAGLQKVSAEIETNRPEPRVASNRD
jgi:Chaperone of endosialidase